MVLHVIVSTFVVILSHCWYFCGDFGSLWYCEWLLQKVLIGKSIEYRVDQY